MGRLIKRNIVAPGHGLLNGPKYIAIHSTANPGATAANHVNYWRNNPKYAVHVVSDWKEAFQCVEYSNLCYQVGNGNRTCIGIEICEATNQARFQEGLYVARQAIIEMSQTSGIPLENMRSHKWFTENYGGSDHTDPIPYFSKFGWSWDDFVKFIMNGDGAMHGWKKTDKGKWWYENSDGSYTTNNWQMINGLWYYFDEEGYAVTGWRNLFTNSTQRYEWYYFCTDKDNAQPECSMLANGTFWIGDAFYSFDFDGHMIVGTIHTDEKGRMLYG